ncbi:sodium-dependent transporter [bacterium]|nr:sodium-dependent transporter [bacterium]
MNNSPRVEWKSRMGFILAAIGSAVGLGNIWRFPYIAYKNGGGAFLIPYITILLLIGIPLMILELGVGCKYKGSTPMAFARLKKKLEWFGWWPTTFLALGIMIYYSVILSWCLNYIVFSINLSWGLDAGDFFLNKFLNLTTMPFEFGDINIRAFVGLVIIWGITWLIVYRGVQKGIEFANKFFIPLLSLAMIVLFVWGLTLDGAIDGIAVFLKPDFSKLLTSSIWIDAFVQAFFSMGIGMGIIVTYASYCPTKTNINQNAVIICVMDALFAIVAGLVVFATLGSMSKATGVPVSEIVRGGPELAFVVYPEAINSLPLGKSLFGIIFFVALLFAGISSSIAIVEPMISAMIDKFNWTRRKAITIFSIVGLLGGLVFVSGAGLYWLDIVDHFINNLGLMVIAFVEAIAIGWIVKTDEFARFIDEHSSFKVGRVWVSLIRYPIPLVLGGFFINNLYSEFFTKPYGGYQWREVLIIGVGWVVMTIIIATIFNRLRWRSNIGVELTNR